VNQITDIPSLFSGNIRWIDVRAPVEFAAGAMPGAVNLPLLNDDERRQVGTTYKEEGPDAAVALGHRLVSGTTKEGRIQAWLEEIRSHPNAVIYCFRGGLRSQTTQAWLRERGVHRPIVAGGYKALRKFLAEVIEKEAPSTKFRVVSGPTGSGKTIYIRSSGKPHLDLEAIARHRGSAFGSTEEAQPSQVDFENRLAIELLGLRGSEEVLVENESRLIGRCYLPEPLMRAMQQSPILHLEVPLEERVENIMKEYVVGTGGTISPPFESFRASVNAISRKLGGQRAQEILGDINQAQSQFERDGGLDENKTWIRKILVWYYDPLYQFSLDRKSKKP
jgi:tRNA 2-selenouridine synthase